VLLGYGIAHIDAKDIARARDVIFDSDHNAMDVLLRTVAEVHVYCFVDCFCTWSWPNELFSCARLSKKW
jgi:hypothetical protein